MEGEASNEEIQELKKYGEGACKSFDWKSNVLVEAAEKKIIEDRISKLTKERVYPNKIVTEVKPLSKFYYAENYHQDYEKNNPNDLYILNVSKPRLNKFKAISPELLKKEQH